MKKKIFKKNLIWKNKQIISLFRFLFGGFVFGISPKIGFIFEGLFSSSSATEQPSTSKATKSSFQSKVCLETKTCVFWTSNHSNLENVLRRYLKIILKRFRWKMKNCYLVVDSVRNLFLYDIFHKLYEDMNQYLFLVRLTIVMLVAKISARQGVRMVHTIFELH